MMNMTKDVAYYMCLHYKVEITRLHPMMGGGWWCTVPMLGEAYMHGEGETPSDAYRDMLEQMPELMQHLIDDGYTITEPLPPDMSYLNEFNNLLMEAEDRGVKATLSRDVTLEEFFHAGVVLYEPSHSPSYFRAFFYNTKDGLAETLDVLKARSIGMEKFDEEFSGGKSALPGILARISEREAEMERQKKEQVEEPTLLDEYLAFGLPTDWIEDAGSAKARSGD